MGAYFGAAAVLGNTVYISQDYEIFAYANTQDVWTKLKRCEHGYFSLAVIDDRLTTIGGSYANIATGNLFCLTECSSEMKWEELLPPMPTARIRPAVVTTPTNLIVAGGLNGDALTVVEVLDTNTLEWFLASSIPKALGSPHMSLCGGNLYLSEHNTIFSCSVEELLKSCKPASTDSSDGGSVWTKLADIPVSHWASLMTYSGCVLSIGGSDKYDEGTPTGAIHCYDERSDSWSVIGEMPTPRYDTLVAVLPSNELIMVGGYDKIGLCNMTEIASKD